VICGTVGHAQQLNTDQVIDRIVQREHDEIKLVGPCKPIIEIYVQDIRTDQQPSKKPVTDRGGFLDRPSRDHETQAEGPNLKTRPATLPDHSLRSYLVHASNPE
jgi:hypothetical protein